MPGFSILPDLGVNLLDDPRRINDRECVRAENMVPFTKGMLGLRPAMAHSGFERVINAGTPVAGVLSPFHQAIAFFACIVPATASDAVGAIKIVAVGPNGIELLLSSIGTVSATGSEEGTPCLFVFQKKVYCLYGPDFVSPGIVIEGSGSTVAITEFAFQGTGNTGLKPQVMGSYRDRAMYANFGAGYENYLAISDPFEPLLVGNDVLTSRAFAVGSPDEGKIVAVIEITQTAVGTPAQGALLILKERAAYLMTGEPNLTTDVVTDEGILADAVVSRIQLECGCAAPYSVVRTPHGVLWASEDDVWGFAIGALPVRLGTKIQPALTANAVGSKKRWHATYFNGFYRLAVYSPGQSGTVTMNLNGSSTHTDWTYPDLPADQWWLDLRDGMPQNYANARWWGPQIYNYVDGYYIAPSTSYIFKARAGVGPSVVDNSTSPPRLLALVPTQVSLASPGGNHTAEVVQLDAHRGARDYEGKTIQSLTEQIHDGMGTDILPLLVTKEFDFGAPYNDKLIRGVKVDYWTNIAANFKVDVILDGKATSSPLEMEADPDALTLGVEDVDFSSGAFRKFQKGYMLDPDVNHTGQTVQFRFYIEAGYYISETMVPMVHIGGVTYRPTTVSGYYSNLKTLVEALDTALTAIGAGFSHGVLGTHTNRPAVLALTFSAAARLLMDDDPGTSYTLEETYLRLSRFFWALLGWDTNTNTGSAITQTAENPVYYTRSNQLQLASLEADVRVFEREPT